MPEQGSPGPQSRLSLGWARIPALTTGIIFAVAGGGFIVATLIMSRVLDEYTFGQAVLMIAFCNVSIAVAPSGLNGIALRHDLRSDVRLLRLGAIAATITAAVASTIGVIVYRFDALSAAILFAAINAGGIALLAKAAFQRAQQFQKMVALYQIANGVLLIAALLMLAGIGREAWFPTLLVGCWYVVLSTTAWRWVLTQQTSGEPLKLHMWRDAANFGGVALAGEVLVQLEKLLLPLTLGTSALALYAVAAAIALAPYRMLELGTASTLTARLRHAHSIDERRALLKRDGITLISLSVAGGGAILLFGPYVAKLVNPQLTIPLGLLFAVVTSGIVRLLSALSYGAASALCSGPELKWINLCSWIAILLGAVAGALLSRMGLEWLVYGVAVGWAWRAVMAAALARKHLLVAGVQ